MIKINIIRYFKYLLNKQYLINVELTKYLKIEFSLQEVQYYLI